jgi:hypothetical protein
VTEQLYELSVNGTAFQVPMKEILGLQIRALAAVDPVYDLILEGDGPNPDRLLGDEEKIALAEVPVRIFTRPPTTMGFAGEQT